MKTAEELKEKLHRLEGRGYKAYKEIKGAYSFRDYTLFIDYVQGDPFATPSRFRIIMSQDYAQFPETLTANAIRRIALADYLTRQFYHHAKKISRKRGIGKSGLIEIDSPRQEILERTSGKIDSTQLEMRFFLGLPARGRIILGKQAVQMIYEDLSRITQQALLFRNLDQQAVQVFVETAEDAESMRTQLKKHKLIAFVGNGALLPRKSGVDPRPLGEASVSFRSPATLETRLSRPNAGPITGMGIPEGVTLIVGGGYHGKSTLLRAIEFGIYNHPPGDGREYVVTDPDAVKIRSEDGRSVSGVDISPFIGDLPQRQSTQHFSTQNASGSTSQAASIIEALEVNPKLLLIDEDTAATNFMIRDHRMQELIAKEKEPITPFIDKVRQLYDDYKVSTLLVIGGSGDYFETADHVIAMENYQPRDVTSEAKAIALKHTSKRRPEGGDSFGTVRDRIPLPQGINPGTHSREVYLKTHDIKTMEFGNTQIDLSHIEQLVEKSQVRAIAHALLYAKTHYIDGQRTLDEITDCLMRDIEKGGLDKLTGIPYGDLAFFRRFEWTAALNRLRTLKVRSSSTNEHRT